jgi:hypothetical protein
MSPLVAGIAGSLKILFKRRRLAEYSLNGAATLGRGGRLTLDFRNSLATKLVR